MDTKKEFVKAFVNNVVKNPRKFTHFASQNLALNGLSFGYKHNPSACDDETTFVAPKGHNKVLVLDLNTNMCIGYGSFHHAMYECLDSEKCIADLAVLSPRTRTNVMSAFLKSVFADLSPQFEVECEESEDFIEGIALWIGANPSNLNCITMSFDNGFGTLLTTFSQSHADMSPSAVIALYAPMVNEVEQEVAPQPKKQKYDVCVHGICSFTTSVEAESEDDAKDIAYHLAMSSSWNEWEFVDYTDKGEIC